MPGANREVYESYITELKRENRPTDNLRFAGGFWFLIVSDDPEKTFAEAADHVSYQVNNYSVWLQAGGLQPLAPHLNDREDLRKSGLLHVVDPDTAIGMTATWRTLCRSPTFTPGRCRRDCRHAGHRPTLSCSPRRSFRRFGNGEREARNDRSHGHVRGQGSAKGGIGNSLALIGSEV